MSEIKSHIQNHPEHHGWLANYLVVKRICTQPNFHDLYLELVKQLEVRLRTGESAVVHWSCFRYGVVCSSFRFRARLLLSPSVPGALLLLFILLFLMSCVDTPAHASAVRRMNMSCEAVYRESTSDAKRRFLLTVDLGRGECSLAPLLPHMARPLNTPTTHRTIDRTYRARCRRRR